MMFGVLQSVEKNCENSAGGDTGNGIIGRTSHATGSVHYSISCVTSSLLLTRYTYTENIKVTQWKIWSDNGLAHSMLYISTLWIIRIWQPSDDLNEEANFFGIMIINQSLYWRWSTDLWAQHDLTNPHCGIVYILITSSVSPIALTKLATKIITIYCPVFLIPTNLAHLIMKVVTGIGYRQD